jgi:hypothetical protein
MRTGGWSSIHTTNAALRGRATEYIVVTGLSFLLAQKAYTADNLHIVSSM